jgi:hypothetical protein
LAIQFLRTGRQPAVDELESGLAQPLLLNEENKEVSEEGDGGDDSEDATSEDSHKPANSFGSAYRLLTPSVKVCFLLRILIFFCDRDFMHGMQNITYEVPPSKHEHVFFFS